MIIRQEKKSLTEIRVHRFRRERPIGRPDESSWNPVGHVVRVMVVQVGRPVVLVGRRRRGVVAVAVAVVAAEGAGAAAVAAGAGAGTGAGAADRGVAARQVRVVVAPARAVVLERQVVEI